MSGESGVIQRSIGFGPVQIVSWALSLSRLILGAEAGEIAVRSSSLDETLTPTNFSLKKISGMGSAHVNAVDVDGRAMFLDKSGQRLIELAYSLQENDFQPRDMTLLHPDLNLNNPVVRVVVQRQPDTRIHCLREDGTVAILVYEPKEEVICWYRVETSGVVEDALVLPGTVEDKVYYCVKRVIGNADRRYWEKFAREDECGMIQLNKQADSFVAYTGAATATITGLSHLNGQTVVAWGDGANLGTFVVSGGQITLSAAVSNCVVGMGYQARFKSAKLAYAGGMGTAMAQKKRINYLGVVMHDTHKAGLQYGPSFAELDELPSMEDGAETDADAGWDHYDKSAFEFAGRWDTDARLCLVANAPRPCTILGAVVGLATHDKG